MAGQIRKLIDRIIDVRANGDDTIKSLTRTKLILKGINIDSYSTSSVDDPAVIQKLNDFAKEMGITL